VPANTGALACTPRFLSTLARIIRLTLGDPGDPRPQPIEAQDLLQHDLIRPQVTLPRAVRVLEVDLPAPPRSTADTLQSRAFQTRPGQPAQDLHKMPFSASTARPRPPGTALSCCHRAATQQEGPTAVPGDQASDLHFLVAGAHAIP
jgi:hypothetical protein